MKVFVLEDDPDVREAVVRYLEAAGYAVDAAGDWESADEHLQVNKYDALVLDRTVPGGDAMDLLVERRSADDPTPAIFLTARDSIRDRVDGLRAGADDYLVKPFAMEELVARVHVLTRRSVVAADPVLVLGDVEVDPAGVSATRAGVGLGLTVKELSILRYLLANANRVVSRSELIEHCWNEFMEPMSNVVDVKVAQLRKKLGSPAIVHTVRGAGYVASETPP